MHCKDMANMTKCQALVGQIHLSGDEYLIISDKPVTRCLWI